MEELSLMDKMLERDEHYWIVTNVDPDQMVAVYCVIKKIIDVGLLESTSIIVSESNDLVSAARLLYDFLTESFPAQNWDEKRIFMGRKTNACFKFTELVKEETMDKKFGMWSDTVFPTNVFQFSAPLELFWIFSKYAGKTVGRMNVCMYNSIGFRNMVSRAEATTDQMKLLCKSFRTLFFYDKSYTHYPHSFTEKNEHVALHWANKNSVLKKTIECLNAYRLDDFERDYQSDYTEKMITRLKKYPYDLANEVCGMVALLLAPISEIFQFLYNNGNCIYPVDVRVLIPVFTEEAPFKTIFYGEELVNRKIMFNIQKRILLKQ